MQKHILRAVLVFISVLCITFLFKKFKTSSNKAAPVATTASSEGSTTLPDDFRVFYNKFHSDSIFQMEHILFPLRGKTTGSDSTNTLVDTIWEKEEWLLHQPFNDHGGTFERTFTNFGGLVTEFISGNGGMFSLEKRYIKSEGEWQLTYYRSMTMHG